MKFEIEIIKTIQSASTPFWDWFFKFISQLGNYFGFAIAFVVIFVALVLIPNPGAHLSPPIGVVKIDGVGVVLS